MGQNQTISSSHITQKEAHKIPAFVEAQISLDESVIRPNGWFPPEIIVFILKYANLTTCIRASQSCKLWYESIQEVFKNMYMSLYKSSESLEDNWKVNFFRRSVMDQNLAKGLWWSESLSAHHYPRWDSFSYVASFEGNKVIFNNHHIHITKKYRSKSDLQINLCDEFKRIFEAGYELDLDTMKKQEIPYGTIYANGFKLRTLMRNDSPAFDWKQYEVFDGTTTRTINRFFEPGVNEENPWNRTRYEIHINMDGSPTVLTTNDTTRYYLADASVRYIEVVDLRSGEIIAKPEIAALQILGFIGDVVIAQLSDGIFFVNIYTTERMQVDPPAMQFEYCKDTRTFASGTREGEIRFYDWPSFEFKSQIDLKAILPPPADENSESQSSLFELKSFAFDKSKLLVAVTLLAPSYAVVDLRTGTLLQTFTNISDRHVESNVAIHLAPNGKIVTDNSNLVVYDFLSPMICKDIPVVFAEYKSTKITKTYVPAMEFSKFAAQKLNAPLLSIQNLTFFAVDKNGQLYRVTAIGSHSDLKNWETWAKIDWTDLSGYLQEWKGDNQVQNTFQITQSSCGYPAQKNASSDMSWSRVTKVLLVYERFDKHLDTWEFAEPLALEDIDIPATGDKMETF